jgi:hypothetical protein
VSLSAWALLRALPRAGLVTWSRRTKALSPSCVTRYSGGCWLPQADRFVRTGRSLQRKMWMQNCKIKIVILLAVLLLGVIIFLLVCFSGQNCLKKH